MTIRHSLALSVAALLVVGCGKPAPAPPVAAGGASSDRLPTLRLHHQSNHLDNSPTDLQSAFAVGPHGLIFSNDRGADGKLYSLIDTTGAVIGRVGREGEGPGEVRGGTVMVSDSSVVVAGDTRLVQFDLHGTPQSTVRTAHMAIQRAFVAPASLLGIALGPTGSRIALTSISTGGIRELLGPADTFFAGNFGMPLRQDGGTRNPTLGVWAGGFIVGDGWSYRLALYHWDGHFVRMLHRDIPAPRLSPIRLDREVRSTVTSLRATGRGLDDAAVERIRSETADRQQRYFGFFRPSGLDALGRIWVLGQDADSGYADVFSEERFLGRIPLPCAGFTGGWSLNGRWLVTACLPDDPDFPGDAVFKVFRIDG